MSMISVSMVFYGIPIKIAMKMGSLTLLFVEPSGKNRYVKYEEHMGLGGVGWGNRSKRSHGRRMGSRSRRIRRSRKNRSRRWRRSSSNSKSEGSKVRKNRSNRRIRRHQRRRTGEEEAPKEQGDQKKQRGYE